MEKDKDLTSGQRQGNQLGNQFSLSAVMFHQAVADKSGLNVTDYKILGTILQRETITPGQLASMTGLSTAAMTTVIDRLEESGLVTRSADPKDRRRSLITANADIVEQQVVPHMSSFLSSMGMLFAQYKPEEIQLIVDFLVKMTGVFKTETEKLRNSD